MLNRTLLNCLQGLSDIFNSHFDTTRTVLSCSCLSCFIQWRQFIKKSSRNVVKSSSGFIEIVIDKWQIIELIDKKLESSEFNFLINLDKFRFWVSSKVSFFKKLLFSQPFLTSPNSLFKLNHLICDDFAFLQRLPLGYQLVKSEASRM